MAFFELPNATVPLHWHASQTPANWSSLSVTTSLSYDEMEIDTITTSHGTKHKLCELYDSLEERPRKTTPVPTKESSDSTYRTLVTKSNRAYKAMIFRAADYSEAARRHVLDMEFETVCFRANQSNESFNFNSWTLNVGASSAQRSLSEVFLFQSNGTAHDFSPIFSSSSSPTLASVNADIGPIGDALKSLTITAPAPTQAPATISPTLASSQPTNSPTISPTLATTQPTSTPIITVASTPGVPCYDDPCNLPDYEDEDDSAEGFPQTPVNHSNSLPSSPLSLPPTPTWSVTSKLSNASSWSAVTERSDDDFVGSAIPRSLMRRSTPGLFNKSTNKWGVLCPNLPDWEIKTCFRRFNKTRNLERKLNRLRLERESKSPSGVAKASSKRSMKLSSKVMERTVDEVNDFRDEVISCLKFDKKQNEDDDFLKAFKKSVVSDAFAEEQEFIGFEAEDSPEDDQGDDEDEDDDMDHDQSKDDQSEGDSTTLPDDIDPSLTSTTAEDNCPSFFVANDIPASSQAQRIIQWQNTASTKTAMDGGFGFEPPESVTPPHSMVELDAAKFLDDMQQDFVNNNHTKSALA